MRRDLLLVVAYVGGFVAVTAALAVGGPLIELDLAVRQWSEQHRPPAADFVARQFNLLGQGSPLLFLSWAAAEWLMLRTRSLRPLLYVSVAAVLVVPVVLGVKWFTERGAPSSPLPPEQVVPLLGPLPAGEYGAGYPSGHVVNAIIWYGVLLTLITTLLRTYGRAEPTRAVRVVVRVAPVAVVFCTTTYLSFHWFTDGLAALALGLAIDRVLALGRWRL